MRGNRVAAWGGLVMAAAVAASAAHVTAPTARAALIGTITVTTTGDISIATDGLCSLREAIIAANTNAALPTSGECAAGGTNLDFIEFGFAAPTVFTIGANLPDITGATTILGAGLVTIDGADLHRVFHTTATASLELANLVIRNGHSASAGGAIRNDGTLTLQDVTVTSSSSDAGGGAIYNTGTQTLERVTLSGNTTAASGGAIIQVTGGASTLLNTTIHGNTAVQGGGAIENEGGSLTIDFTTITKNTATNRGSVGGIRQTSGTIHLWSSIVAGNSGANVSVAGSSSTKANIVDVPTTSILASTLEDNGGLTRTVRLLSTATAALDLGDATGTCPGTDQRGHGRVNGQCDIGAVERDTAAPSATFQALELRQGVALSGTSARVTLTFTGFDDSAGRGIDHFTVQRQVNGGSWSTLTTAVAGTVPGEGNVQRTVNTTLKNLVPYRFRVRAVDQDGNVSPWVYSGTVKPKLVEQTSSAVHFSSGWTTVSSTKFSGGSARKSTTTGRVVRISFTGRAIAFVTTFRPTAVGTVTVTVDGVATPVPGFASSSTTYRVQGFVVSFPSSGSHTLRVRTTGSARVDTDGFVILK